MAIHVTTYQVMALGEFIGSNIFMGRVNQSFKTFNAYIHIQLHIGVYSYEYTSMLFAKRKKYVMLCYDYFYIFVNHTSEHINVKL